MADPIRRYNIITLRPHWAQYIISQGMSFIISCALFLVAGHDSITYKMPFVVLGGVMTCIMLCKVAESLIQKHGFQGAEKLLKQNPELWKNLIIKMQTPTMLAVFNVLADYQLDNALYFFRSRIEDAFSSRDYCGQMPYDRTHRGKNDSIFERLDTTFSFEQAQQQSISVKGANTTLEAVKQMLKNWKRQGLIVVLPDMRYQKLSSTV